MTSRKRRKRKSNRPIVGDVLGRLLADRMALRREARLLRGLRCLMGCAGDGEPKPETGEHGGEPEATAAAG
jgi:hypothetical protein